MSRTAKAKSLKTELKNKFHKKTPTEKMEKIIAKLEEGKTKVEAKLVILNNKATEVQGQDKKQGLKTAREAVKYKKYICDCAEEMAGEFAKAILLIEKIENEDDSHRLLAEAVALKEQIEATQDAAIEQMDNITEIISTNIDERAGEALVALENSLPSAAGYYIYHKEIWRVDNLDETAVLSLTRDKEIHLKKITKEEFGIFEVMAKWPKGWFDSPVDFIKNIFKAKIDVNINRKDQKTIKTTNTDGYIDELKLTQEELVRVLVKFNRILIEAKIKGSVSLSVGHQGSLGTITLSSEAAYEASVWAKASIKSLNASVGASIQAEISSTIGFESKEAIIAGKKLSFDLTAQFKVYGRAQAIAAAGAMIMGKTENMGGEDSVIGNYTANNADLGKAAIDGTMGFTAGAWAGIGAAVELSGSVSCDIKGTRTKLVGIAEEFHVEIGIGGKVDINLDHSTDTDDFGNEYDVAALTVGLTCLGGAEFVTKVSIWKELYKKAFVALKEFSLKETKAYIKPHIKECRDKATEVLTELIGQSIKEAAQKVKQNIEHSWDTGIVRKKGLTLLDKLGKHKLAVEGKINRHELILEDEHKKVVKDQAKLDAFITQTQEALTKYRKIKKQYEEIKDLSDEDFKEELDEYFAQIQEVFGSDAIRDEMLEVAKSHESKEDALKILNSTCEKAKEEYYAIKAKREKQKEKLAKSITSSTEYTQKYNDYLDKHYHKNIVRAEEKLNQLGVIIDEITSDELSEKLKEKIRNQINKINEVTTLLDEIMTHKKELLAEAKSDDNISKSFYKELKAHNEELKHERTDLLAHIKDINLELKKLGV